MPQNKLSENDVLALRGRTIENVFETDDGLIILLRGTPGQGENNIKVGLGHDPGLDLKGYPIVVVKLGSRTIWTS